MVLFIETASEMVVARGWGVGGGGGELVLNGDRVSVLQEERVVEMTGWRCYSTTV